MNAHWQELVEIGSLPEIVTKSAARPQVLFKHSTRCSISTMALNRLERLDVSFYEQADFYYLDLLAHRDISLAIENEFNVQHQSPQVIIIINGVARYDVSHGEINVASLFLEVNLK